MKEVEARVFVAQATLISQGFITQTNDGMRPTEKGLQKAEEIWNSLSDENKLLLIPYLRKHLFLKYDKE